MAVPAKSPDQRPFERVLQLLDRTVVRRPTTGEDWEDIFRLRYNAYRTRDYIESNESRLDSDHFDFADNTFVFGIFVDDQLSMSIRIHHLDREHPDGPSRESYPNHLNSRLLLGQSFIDCSRFAIDPDLDPSVDRAALRFMPPRLSAMAALFFEADYILHLVRPRHKAFYQRYFHAETFATGGECGTVTFPVDLTATRIGANDQRMLDRLPFLHSLESERAMLFDEETARRCCFCARPTAQLVLKRMNDNDDGVARLDKADAASGAAA
ncbi:N-acyl amino acid synthase FeeM domain-containing protein [Notoacmeibacter marinus]|uniref:N-acyl amino acid synthase FeeM domain-containing protein n=1 Tax=Notoacmeibacter marinus TaxID=1876515 RepID=UPI000DF1C951|nr:hypothetical protein [Notoacmeibacter marinus]